MRIKVGRQTVLVAVLKDERDLRYLLEEGWYRIPVSFLPKRRFTYIAFYQPAVFGQDGKQIEYYARIHSKTKAKRVDLLPGEPNHPRANDDYLKYTFGTIRKLRPQ
jgi:hypothetical protein